MCGIAGLHSKQQANAPFDRDTLGRMNDRLAHRGPDGEGLAWFEEAHIGLAHRRLSIIDLSDAAAQPMAINERYWLSFNGEIYNYLELREELSHLGAQFSSASDAEVLLQAYNFWGEACLQRFNGMWAFAIYDKVTQRIFCARDPYGVKPFYYLNNAQHFGFASEIKALLEIPSYVPAVNLAALQTFLIERKIETNSEGFFKGIFELEPGHVLRYKLQTGLIQTEKYEQAHNNNTSIAQIPVKQALFDAVSLRLRADVPIGFCLSGGLDSSSLLYVASQINKHENISSLKVGLHAFTAAHDSELDERAWAQQMIEQTNANWHISELKSPDLLSALQALIYHQDIPLLSTSTFAQSSVMKSAAAQQIKILIDGQGGDELFAGYQVFYPTYFKELFWSGKWTRFIREWHNLNSAPTSKSYIIKEWIKDVLSYFPNVIQLWSQKRKHPASSYLNAFQVPKRKRFRSLQEHLAFYCQGYELKGLLRWEDRCSMQYSIESRTPFADDSILIQLARSLNSAELIQNGWSKYALRKALDGDLPKTITWRRDKKGFSVPESQWLMETQAYWEQQIKAHAHLDKSGLVNTERLLHDLPHLFSDSQFENAQNFVFRYANYLIWLHTFQIKDFA
jgi:asparagine synthase (glutamine-hydrolysing)